MLTLVDKTEKQGFDFFPNHHFHDSADIHRFIIKKYEHDRFTEFDKKYGLKYLLTMTDDYYITDYDVDDHHLICNISDYFLVTLYTEKAFKLKQEKTMNYKIKREWTGKDSIPEYPVIYISGMHIPPSDPLKFQKEFERASVVQNDKDPSILETMFRSKEDAHKIAKFCEDNDLKEYKFEVVEVQR